MMCIKMKKILLDPGVRMTRHLTPDIESIFLKLSLT